MKTKISPTSTAGGAEVPGDAPTGHGTGRHHNALHIGAENWPISLSRALGSKGTILLVFRFRARQRRRTNLSEPLERTNWLVDPGPCTSSPDAEKDYYQHAHEGSGEGGQYAARKSTAILGNRTACTGNRPPIKRRARSGRLWRPLPVWKIPRKLHLSGGTALRGLLLSDSAEAGSERSGGR